MNEWKLKMSWVSFPGLGIGRINVSQFVINFAGIQIRWYGLIIGIAVALSFTLAFNNAKKVGLSNEKFPMIFLIIFFSGFIGARAFYVVFNFKCFKDDLMSVFNLRTGGLAIYGGLILATVCSIAGCKFFKIKWQAFADLAGVSVLLGQAIGRWGNFFNIEAYGVHTNLPFGMFSCKITDVEQPVHPTFLYESVWCFFGFLILNSFLKKRKFDGQIALCYLAWYGFGRFFIERLRADSLWLIDGVIKVSQLISALIFIAAIVLLFVFSWKFKKMKFKVWRD